MDSNTIILALAGAVSTLAGLYAQELRTSRDNYRDEARDYQEQLKLNTEALRELSTFVRDSVPLIAELRFLLPALREIVEDKENPQPRTRTRRTA